MIKRPTRVSTVNPDGSPGRLLELEYSRGEIIAKSTDTNAKMAHAKLMAIPRSGSDLYDPRFYDDGGTLKQEIWQWGIFCPFTPEDIRWVNTEKEAIQVIRRIAAPHRSKEARFAS